MSSTEPRRKPPIAPRAALAALLAAAAAPAHAAEGLWDTVLETMNVKAAPPGPAPDFVARTRPDSADLGYLPTATPHKVSPLPVKSAAQIQAAKDALDTAKARQLSPGAPKALPSAKLAKGAKTAAPAGAAPAGAAPAAD